MPGATICTILRCVDGYLLAVETMIIDHPSIEDRKIISFLAVESEHTMELVESILADTHYYSQWLVPTHTGLQSEEHHFETTLDANAP